MSNIYEKLNKIQVEFKCGKNQTNKFGGYQFRSCSDILEAVKPLLEKHKVVLTVTDEILLIGERFYVKATATVHDTEGEGSVSASAYAREGESQKGMSEAQLTGSTSSYARKYALNGLFSIDDVRDDDSTNTHGATSNSSKTPSKVSEKQIKRLIAIAIKKGYNAEQLSGMVYKKYQKATNDLTKEEYDVIVSGLEKLADKN